MAAPWTGGRAIRLRFRRRVATGAARLAAPFVLAVTFLLVVCTGASAQDDYSKRTAKSVDRALAETVGHGPAVALIEGDRPGVVDSCMQLEVPVPGSANGLLAECQQPAPEAPCLLGRIDEEMNELMAPGRDVGDRDTLDDDETGVELGARLKPRP